MSLSHTILDEVTKLASEQKWATGGHVLCAIYEFVKNEAPAVAGNDDVEANAAAGNAPAAGGVEVAPEFDGPAGEMFFIVAMVKQRGGLTLDANLVPVGINEVDMSKLHQAALIRVGRYNTVKALPPLQEDSDDEHDRIYLSFVSQHANRGSSSYFIHALGCVVGVSPAKATTKLFAAVDAFFTERKPLLPYRRSAKERLTAHLQNASENGKPVTIDGLYELLIREVPPDLAEQVRDIAEFLNDERRQVPATFEVSKSVLTRFASVALNGEGYTVKFEKSLLGTDVNSDFHYDKEQKTLTIRNLSPDVTARLDKVLTGG
ncbi:hypothetical protein AXG89_07470 [Burkholderia sp. PAMC 26561]|nr:hypothetical protein AXG89_07470 [Burkholderia sp. PAMC 26561]